MSFERKKAHALALMKSKNLWLSNYVPPLVHGLWKLGINIPPLPFAPVWQVIIIMGLDFGIIWGIFMWFCDWRSHGVQPSEAFVRSLMYGVFSGVASAAFHRWRKRVHNLPDWKDL
ncbi:hypothetical protein AFK62_11905 [Cronobacter condimenti 1330]|uniref:Uncharacterized protein n=4 Tax=Cronobacter condimenti TaxID=1163710 RepID=A0ABM5VDI2_9ENTR|nr:DUF6404 family protein [Cronobacter condimenti]ALB63166.1 hypothetical protein AFK62_11905 [Cronobacter condimenti 1330]